MLYFVGNDGRWKNRPCRTGSISRVLHGSLEQAKASTRRFLGVPVALQFVFCLQASPFIRIYGLEFRFSVFAIGGGLWCEQCLVRSANSRLGVSVVSRVPETHGGRFDFMHGRIEVARSEISCAPGDGHCE